MSNKRKRIDDEANDSSSRGRKAIKNDMETIHELTLKKLMSSKGKAPTSPKAMSTTVDVEGAFWLPDACYICKAESTQGVKCSYCERDICVLCIRQCDKCKDIFCNFCTTMNYDESNERLLCLGCNSDELSDKKTAILSPPATPMKEPIKNNTIMIVHKNSKKTLDSFFAKQS